jgi:hypothetical protein
MTDCPQIHALIILTLFAGGVYVLILVIDLVVAFVAALSIVAYTWVREKLDHSR